MMSPEEAHASSCMCLVCSKAEQAAFPTSFPALCKVSHTPVTDFPPKTSWEDMAAEANCKIGPTQASPVTCDHSAKAYERFRTQIIATPLGGLRELRSADPGGVLDGFRLTSLFKIPRTRLPRRGGGVGAARSIFHGGR